MPLRAYVLIVCACALSAITGCITTGKTAPQSAKKSPERLFGRGDVAPKGNSALHYIDSRLYSYRDSEGPSIDALKRSVDEDPTSSYLHAELARSLAEQNQFEQATLEIEKALELEPASPNNHLLKGKIFSVKQMPVDAMREYEACTKLDAEIEDCYIMLAREQLVARDQNAALKTIQRLLVAVPNSTSGLYYQGTIYSAYLKDNKKAIKSFQSILDEDSDDLRALGALSQLYLDAKNYNEALKYLLEVERLAPLDVPIKLKVGLLYYELKEFDKAIDRFTEALSLSPANDRVSYYLGLLEAQRKNYESAFNYFKSIPPDSELYKEAVVRSVLVLKEMQALPKAIGLAQDALKKRQDIPELYEVLGTLYGREGRYDQAFLTLNKGLKKFPNHEKLLFSKGVMHDKAGQFEKSIATMRELVVVNPKNASALNYIGYSYADRGIHLDEALDLVTMAYQIKPDDGYIVDSLAWVYFKQGNPQKALELLLQANKISPNEPVILEHLGDVYLELGAKEKAKNYFQEAVAAAVKQESTLDRDVDDLKRIQSKLSALGGQGT